MIATAEKIHKTRWSPPPWDIHLEIDLQFRLAVFSPWILILKSKAARVLLLFTFKTISPQTPNQEQQHENMPNNEVSLIGERRLAIYKYACVNTYAFYIYNFLF